MSEALVFAALALTAIFVASWIDDVRARRDARRRNQATPWKGWRH